MTPKADASLPIIQYTPAVPYNTNRLCWFYWFILFNNISTSNKLFNTEISLISKYLIGIINTFSMVYLIFLNCTFVIDSTHGH